MSPERRPQVLVFIDWYRPFFKAGGPVRSLVNLVDQLSDRLDLCVVTGDRDYMDPAPSSAVALDQWTTGTAGERVWFASRAGRTVGRWRALLQERPWDVIHLNGLFSPWTTAIPLWLTRGMRVRRIIAVRGMLAPDALAGGRTKKLVYLRVLRLTGCLNGVEYQATSAEEVEAIRSRMGRKAVIHLAPNLARKEPAPPFVPVEKVVGELRVISVARIAPEKNTMFAIQCLRVLRGKVVLDLYGTVYDQAYWQWCQEAIAGLPPNITVNWHGHVDQEQVRGTILRAHALLLPTWGENFGHTILESLCAGRPVVISDRTPWRELVRDAAGWDLPLEHPQGFTEVLQTLIDMDRSGMERLANGAFRRGMRYLDDPAPLAASRAMFGA